ncbi:sialoadhesin [Cololabis saira]|uniref:sialoadhesin n=1 Tax=Cololabis saira TaxID=129043 RepID=UPI002AD5A7E3|nr:sialoadhesin [Cololabis saira]
MCMSELPTCLHMTTQSPTKQLLQLSTRNPSNSEEDSYVHLLFVDFTSAFNTIRRQTLVQKLTTPGLSSSLCNWVLDFLTARPQSVRIHDVSSSSITLSAGIPQGCVLSPILTGKFADDTAVVGRITNNDESCYRQESKGAAMHAGTAFLSGLLIFGALWTEVQPASPVPSVPDRVQALVGSCVVIPCSFTPRTTNLPRRQRERLDVQLRFKNDRTFFALRGIAFDSQDKQQVSRNFQGRTSLFGRITDGDCSVKIDRITRDESKLFEIALKKGGELVWGKPMRINLDVIDTPEPPVISGALSATEGQLVTLNCSVSYHCPSSPPALQWRWEHGARLNSTDLLEVQALGPHAHKLMASVSFTVAHQVKPRLVCEVNYPGAQTVATAKNLHVKFPPKDVKIQVQTLTVHEGGSALLVCSCKADPPASEYRWWYSQHGRTVRLHQRTHTVRVFNVTRDMRVHCSAQNLVGRGESKPTSLNIQYKPAILRLSSACVVEDSKLLCNCSVDSNPRSAVTWSVNGTSPPHDYNASVKSEPNALTASLRGRMDKPLTVICFAINSLGNDSLVLLEGEEETALLLWLVIPAAAVCLAFAFLFLLIYCCRKRAGRQVLQRPPSLFPGGLGIYQERMPLYINCTEVTHVYTNGSYQLVYQNCTPLFVHTKQIRPMGRRGGERRRGEEAGWAERRPTREVQGTAGADPETAVYVEIL